jgi:CDP-glycerol glycerophosphotransferase (TagB/SpsB family)
VFGGAVAKSYSDNSRALFEHVRLGDEQIEARWVLSEMSADWNAVAREVRVVAESLDTHRLAMRASVLVYSHGVHDIPGMEMNRRALKVRLGHGLTALKRKHFRTVADQRRFVERIKEVGLITVASPMDQTFTLEWGAFPEQIAITGLPRWDRLVGLRATAERRRVVYAPTWRSWTDPEPAVRQIMALLCSRHFRDICRSHGMIPTLYCHPNMRGHLNHDALTDAAIEVVHSDRNADKLLAETAVMITDYSSTCWDALYVDIPVIFYMFDRASYERHAGSYIDLDTLFGWQAYSEKEVFAALAWATDVFLSDAQQPAGSEWKSRAFVEIDDKNCSRVMSAIGMRHAM